MTADGGNISDGDDSDGNAGVHVVEGTDQRFAQIEGCTLMHTALATLIERSRDVALHGAC